MSDQLELFSPHREVLAAPTPLTFDQREGERLKRLGMQLAAGGRPRQLAHAREVAIDVARGILPHADGVKAANGLCSADDVAAQFERDKLPWIGNSAGSIFTDGNWEWSGEFTKSARVGAHANLLRIWKFKHPI